MTDPRDLVLLTAEFPFGNKSEPFLETEIEVLAQRFERVFVLPSHTSETVRPLPDNVTVVEMPWLDAPTSGEKRRALLSGAALRVLLTTLRRPGNWMPYLGSARMYMDILARNVLKSREIEGFIREHGLADAVFYDYWFENSTIALALLRRAGVVSTAVSRAHGFDVYDERWQGRPVPFREFKASGLDAVFPVSEFGARYLRERWPRRAAELRVSRLGVTIQAEPPAETDNAPLIVTCSSLVPLKRVHLVPQVLANLGRPVRWVHMGDGPERARVEAAASELPDRVRWTLAGHLDNTDVLAYYRSHNVTALLSLSLSEGIPVSMMEAMSFGVPVVAVGVCGIPEIVNEETGVLLPEDATVDDVRAGLTRVLEGDRFDRARIRGFFAEHYEAQSNYNAFVDVLMALEKG